ncbi:MAG: cysteine--tRNA ligase [Candidatus Margulisbacteria bacterium]|nr:cysteine--tRNA ligase [Candidatus Margulisiibacteriota bacterium]
MTLRIYNTLSGQKEEFQPISDDRVRMYVCGITPYDETHLGHARAYVTFDVIRRYLEYLGYKVEHAQNITDIDDKIIQKSKLKSQSCQEIAEQYTQAYFEVMDALNVKRAGEYPRATENIPQMIKFIQGLIDKGYAYVVEGDVYFEVSKFADYGKLSKRKLDDMQSGARVKIDERKKSPLDFALWKAAKEGEPYWETPWGKGRPGWHIECSVMSSGILGDQFDIHGGGLDLVFPHHENELAQSEAFTGKKPWVKYWVHNGFVNVNQQKMSKSLGNFFTLKDIYKKFDPMAVRMFLLGSHYKSPINFSDAQLKESGEAFKRLARAVKDLDFYIENLKGHEAEEEVAETNDEIENLRARFKDAMDDDFNTAAALAVLFEMVSLINREIKEQIVKKASLLAYKEAIVELAGVLGLVIVRDVGTRGDTLGDVEKLIEERSQAKKNKDFKKADEIRDSLKERGIILEDTPQGTKWSKE